MVEVISGQHGAHRQQKRFGRIDMNAQNTSLQEMKFWIPGVQEEPRSSWTP